jgi:dUTP pyrophosphatase
MTLYIRIENAELRELVQTQISNHRYTDSGFDIPMIRQTVNLDEYTHSFRLGVQVAAVDNAGRPMPCLLLPRSSLHKTPFRLANSIGLIDAGYRGEVQAKVDILHTPEHTMNDIHVVTAYDAGTRMFQICQHNFLPWTQICIVDELPAAHDNRGTGGFGSTTLDIDQHSRT